MLTHLAVFDIERTTEFGRRIAKLARFCGLSTITINPAKVLTANSCVNKNTALAVHSRTLAALALRMGVRASSLLESFGAAFVYGFERSSQQELLGQLTCGMLGTISELPRGRTRYRFAHSTLCHQLAGLTFTANGDRRRPVFEPTEHTGNLVALLYADDRPYYVRTECHSIEIFLCAGQSPPDLDSHISHNETLNDRLPELLPFLIFAKHSFGPACWQNPFPRATLIIDDPLLRPRYGFLSHEALLKSLEKYDFASTLAFIPWNYRRSDRRITDLYKRNSSRLSICVHGCDHTGGEFGSTDEGALARKASRALQRMRAHDSGTGLVADRVMVFPQGVFSKASLAALAAAGFTAAVNTTLLPTDAGSDYLTLQDFLSPAIEAQAFPLFGRHYPKSVFPFALDLFLGKPVLVAAHHDIFKDGYSDLCRFVENLRRLEPRLQWAPLQRALTVSGLYQRRGDSARVRFYTDSFQLRNPYEKQLNFRFSCAAGALGSVRDVRLNGQTIPSEIADGLLSSQTTLPSGGEARVQVVRNLDHSEAEVVDSGFNLAVTARRYLSELRDNCLGRSERLWTWSRGAVRLFSS